MKGRLWNGGEGPKRHLDGCIATCTSSVSSSSRRRSMGIDAIGAVSAAAPYPPRKTGRRQISVPLIQPRSIPLKRVLFSRRWAVSLLREP